MQSYGIPQGMRDILAEESSRRTILQEKLLHYMQACGFSRIETPLFEYHDLFSGGISPINDDSIIKTIDREGKVVVLRPDMTIPAARLAATKLKDRQKPMKLFYMGNVYRADSKNRGAISEYSQIGAEIYGCNGKWTDIELIMMARDCIREAELSSYKIDIGHTGIINGIFEELSLKEEERTYIRTLISEKNLVELENEVSKLGISSKYGEILCDLPCLFGKPEDIFKKLEKVAVNKISRKSADYLIEVCEKLKDLGLGPNIIIDAGMTGSINYYTGLIFKAYAKGTSNVLISGGRYDELLAKLGLKSPAAGFAVYIDGMAEALMRQHTAIQKGRKIMAVFNESRFTEALEHAVALRKKGVTVNLLNINECTDLESYAAEYGYEEILKFI
jgi:ATP phosphoribosyltransferase regulatory subunit